jgi:predicted amidophosphoribosyltransferase
VFPSPAAGLPAFLDWLLPARCPLCGRGHGGGSNPCQSCCRRLLLPPGGLSGCDPLPWWAAGAYEGALRRELLGLRRRPRAAALRALVTSIRPPVADGPQHPLLVSVPSWKLQPNPLPPLLAHCLARQLGLEQAPLLRRAHPVLGQHHLGRALRFANQLGSFACEREPRPGEARRRPLLLVDDIVTSGATALAAAEALSQKGWRVEGVLCLARTPERRRRSSRVRGGCDLELPSRHGDRPG